MRKPWVWIWQLSNSAWGGWIPERLAPWLLGKALGAKPIRVQTWEEAGYDGS